MLSLQIKNYDEFREIFGTRHSSHGRIINKILLSFWKYRFKIDGDARAMQIKRLPDLYKLVMDSLYYRSYYCQYLIGTGRLSYRISTNLYPPVGSGIDCTNPKNIKYKDIKHQGKVYSMGAGKYLRTILKENKVRLDEATITFCAEEFQRLWEGEVKNITSGLTLHVNQNFSAIYDSYKCKENFGSCMVDKDRHRFYENCVKASAAYLTNTEGKIVARCIVFHDVLDSEGNVHNYAERQYSSNGDNILKTILVNKLLEAGVIDIFKTVGMGCRDITAISNINGVAPLRQLRIQCRIPHGHVLSFMDTFVYYNSITGIAYNFNTRGCEYNLGHTTRTFSGNSNPMELPPIDRSNLPNI